MLGENRLLMVDFKRGTLSLLKVGSKKIINKNTRFSVNKCICLEIVNNVIKWKIWIVCAWNLIIKWSSCIRGIFLFKIIYSVFFHAWLKLAESVCLFFHRRLAEREGRGWGSKEGGANPFIVEVHSREPSVGISVN